MPKDDRVRFGHMLDAAKQAAEFCQGRSRNELDTNSMLVRLLETIGEAARAVSADGRAAHPAIPWKKIIGMRDRVVHGYFDINLDVVWETVTHDLPSLIAALESLLSEGPVAQ